MFKWQKITFFLRPLLPLKMKRLVLSSQTVPKQVAGQNLTQEIDFANPCFILKGLHIQQNQISWPFRELPIYLIQ